MSVVPFAVQIRLQTIKHIYFFAEQHIHTVGIQNYTEDIFHP
jgi:hypothetical protein